MSDADLYEVLGVPKDADKAAINRAYRKAAADAHPDRGGDPDRFALVALAGNVLRDESLKAHYDATGKTEKDAEITEIFRILSAGLDMLFAATDARGSPPIEQLDVIEGLHHALGDMLAAVDKQLAPMQKAVKGHRKLIDRFKTKGGRNMMDELIRSKIGQIEAAMTPLLTQRELVVKAEAMLADYTFDQDETPFANFQAGGAFTYTAGRF